MRDEADRQIDERMFLAIDRFEPPTPEALAREARIQAWKLLELKEAAIVASGVTELHQVAMSAVTKHPQWIRAYETIFAGIQCGGTYALIGDRDRGKTMLACMLVADLATRKRAHYIKLSTIIRKIKSTWNSRRMTEEQVFEALLELPVLIIDELHECISNEVARSLLADLIDSRYAQLRGTLLIANFSVKQLLEVFSDSTQRRMSERGGIIDANWPRFSANGVTPEVQKAIELKLQRPVKPGFPIAGTSADMSSAAHNLAHDILQRKFTSA